MLEQCNYELCAFCTSKHKYSKISVTSGQNILIKEYRLCSADRGRGKKRTLNSKEGGKRRRRTDGKELPG